MKTQRDTPAGRKSEFLGCHTRDFCYSICWPSFASYRKLCHRNIFQNTSRVPPAVGAVGECRRTGRYTTKSSDNGGIFMASWGFLNGPSIALFLAVMVRNLQLIVPNGVLEQGMEAEDDLKLVWSSPSSTQKTILRNLHDEAFKSSLTLLQH